MEKRGLGKGLGALIPGAERRTVPQSEIAVEEIVANRYQPRQSFDDDKFKDLVKSVRLHGILQPLVVRVSESGGYELVAGERRLRAAVEAGLSSVPVIVRELTDGQSLEVALIENLQREDIGALEAAAAYQRLVDEFGMTQDEIAHRIGKSRSSIANTLRLLNLPKEIQESLRASEITEGHARALLAVSDESHRRRLWQKVKSNDLSVRETEGLCRDAIGGNVSRETSAKPSQRRQSVLDPNILDAEENLRRRLATRVSITVGREKGKIEIEFYTEEDLVRILNVLGEG